jgi:hypothetical protein
MNKIECAHYTTNYDNKHNIKQVGWFVVLNATFNNISAISWQSVLLVEETLWRGLHISWYNLLSNPIGYVQ